MLYPPMRNRRLRAYFSVLKKLENRMFPSRSLFRATLPLMFAAALSTPVLAQSVSFQGQTFTNKGLIGMARVPSNAVDKYGDTISFGSGMAVLPGSWHKRGDGSFIGTFLMLPDRGWNTQGTIDYAGRLYRYQAILNPYYGAGPTGQNQVALTYKTSNLFHEPHQNTSGLDPLAVRPASGNLPPLPQAPNGKISIDDEGVVYPGDGTMWVSDEYGPYVYHYTASGKLIGAIRPPEAFVPKRLSNGVPVDNFSANSPPQGQSYNTGNPVSGRQNNQGMEGLAISPDHKTLFVLMQSALIQDLDATSSTTIKNTRRNARMLAFDISGATPTVKAEYVVQLPLYGAGLTAAQSELKALNDHQFLVLARDSGNGHGAGTGASLYRSVDLIDISGATNIANAATGTDYDNPDPVTKTFTPVAPKGVLNASIIPAAYQKFVDINDATQLAKFGLHNGLPYDQNDLDEKWESIAVLPAFDKQNPNDYFLVVATDNDFITQDGHMLGQTYMDASGVNNDMLMLVFRVTLPTYQPG
jgi:hypothetical protein